MLERIFEKVNAIKKNNCSLLLMIEVLNSIVLIYLIYRIIQQQKVIPIIILFISLFIISHITYIIKVISNTKLINKIMHEEFLPYLIENVSFKYKLTTNPFDKTDVMKSLIISQYGSLKSFNIVKGLNNDIPVEFSYINNFISSGQSYHEVFSGTYLQFLLNVNYDGIIQIRDKGKAEKNKKMNLVCRRYKLEKHKDLHIYTNHDELAKKIVTDSLIQIYRELKSPFKKGFYLTLYQNQLMIGIHNRKNLFRLGVFKKLDRAVYNKVIAELKKIDFLIDKTTRYIQDYLSDTYN